ncbi:hypothetical protein CCP3SC1AL1_310008 [Gammaproteobacteria bacterium]
MSGTCGICGTVNPNCGSSTPIAFTGGTTGATGAKGPAGADGTPGIVIIHNDLTTVVVPAGSLGNVVTKAIDLTKYLSATGDQLKIKTLIVADALCDFVPSLRLDTQDIGSSQFFRGHIKTVLMESTITRVATSGANNIDIETFVYDKVGTTLMSNTDTKSFFYQYSKNLTGLLTIDIHLSFGIATAGGNLNVIKFVVYSLKKV